MGHTTRSIGLSLSLVTSLAFGCGGDGASGDGSAVVVGGSPAASGPAGTSTPAAASGTATEDPASAGTPTDNGAAGAASEASAAGSGAAVPAAGSDGSTGGGEMTATPIAELPTPGPFPEVSDFSQPGPYTSTTLVNVGPGSIYTVYLPQQDPPDGAGNPLVAWTSGGGTSHAFYTLLPHLASHGFVVITSNTIPGIGGEALLGEEIIAGIDWALAEHARAGGMLEGRLDTTKIASTGYSMGSLATFMIASDPRLTTTVHISGGNMVPERVQNLHAPAAFICGIPNPACTDLLSASCDIAGANCELDFEGADTQVFYATFESGHLGILTSPFMERINAMTTAWLRHYLMGDTTLAPMFFGDGCDYCSDPDWTVERKGFQ
ncbi:MAG: hypothetical protein OEZ06_09400 [Myxococcales bacterium]|nr:hypothetical protein [Myxococcales bacterium]